MCPGSLDVCCKDPDFVKPVKPTPSPFTKEDSQESKESEEDETDYGIGSLFDAVPLSHCVDAQGNLHKLGESYTAQDGCNTCTCQELTAACTLKLCPPDAPLSHCVDAQGNLHKLGESYTAQDGCNTCTCQEKT